MLIALLEHLRYISEPVWWWIVAIQWIGLYAGIAMCLGLVGLAVRRIVVDRIRYISAPSDHLMLLLLLECRQWRGHEGALAYDLLH
ncbi:MAG: hypothetical protein CM1200mP41_00270 [Gammaproteobacteria bacterium]|nr:MAG: hypothetical protein CM1200mP41_00270 [Gammaproteobacteria bacterium]